jgi:gamma-glutamylcyclotransferase (GGCT)/AIG2-like uncharacterized protein YtfP
MDLFAYGTLMDASVMRRAAACLPASIPATLYDFQRYRVKGKAYPGIIRQPGSSVAGLLYLGVPTAAWSRLDVFEGDLYYRDVVLVIRQDSKEVQAATYIIKEECTQYLSTSQWNCEHFLQSNGPEFRNCL